MNAALPPEIEVREEHDGIRFLLPPRRLGPLRFFGCLPMGFGLVFSGFAVFWIAGAARSPGGLAFALFGVPFVIAGLVPFAFGVFILAGRSEIALRGGRIVAIDRAGPFWWSRSRHAERLVRFRVGSKYGHERQAPAFLANLGMIVAEFDGARELHLATGYPIDWLTALADDLSRRRELTSSGARPPVDRIDVVPLDRPATAPAERPAGSNAVLETRADGLTLDLPPLGLRKGSKGLFIFAIVWLVFVGTFTGTMIATGAPLPAFLFILLFWAIGVGLLLGSIHLGRRRCRLEVTAEKVVWDQASPIRRRRREWPRAAVAEVQVGPSNWKVNDREVPELQILPAGGRKFGMLAGRDEEELRWMAGVIGEALHPKKAKADRCAACGSPLEDPLVYCPRCMTAHHEACWQDAGRCAAPGCRDAAG